MFPLQSILHYYRVYVFMDLFILCLYDVINIDIFVVEITAIIYMYT